MFNTHANNCKLVGLLDRPISGNNNHLRLNGTIAKAGDLLNQQVEMVNLPSYNEGILFRILDKRLKPYFFEGDILLCEQVAFNQICDKDIVVVENHYRILKIRQCCTKDGSHLLVGLQMDNPEEGLQPENILQIWRVREKLTFKVLQEFAEQS